MRPQSMTLSSYRRKRIFDCTVALLVAPCWLPVLAVCAGLILLLEGRPVFNVSQRQVGIGPVLRILKFRTTRRNADKILNRDAVPSTVYTPIGRLIERLALTELPQLLHAVSGKMSLVGSRPLPTRVMDILRERYPEADNRFLGRAGLTGPVQLIRRDAITDTDRLALETEYSRIAAGDGYCMRLDFWLLLYTVLVVVIPGRLLTVEQVREKMFRLAGSTSHRPRLDGMVGCRAACKRNTCEHV
jgi:lipopolysaccharide/colanic/teichoic acid biosynthesis glycosyltransferase